MFNVEISCRRSLRYKFCIICKKNKGLCDYIFDKMDATRVVVVLCLIQSRNIIQIQYTTKYFLVICTQEEKTDVLSLIPRTKMFKTIIIDTIIINHLLSFWVSFIYIDIAFVLLKNLTNRDNLLYIDV